MRRQISCEPVHPETGMLGTQAAFLVAPQRSPCLARCATLMSVVHRGFISHHGMLRRSTPGAEFLVLIG